MSDLRSRVLGENEETPSGAILALDDFIPLFGAVSLLPIIINAAAYAPLTKISLLGAIGIASGTFVSVVMFLVAASSLRTTEMGRYIAVLVALPVIFLGLSGLIVTIPNITAVVFVIVAAVTIDLQSRV